jgi:formamidopyrimidine-DNA glycosylase
MPELPEVETVRRSLAPHIVGRRVMAVSAAPVKLRLGIEPGEWRSLAGVASLRGLHRRGKYILADFGASTAVLHLGMSGRLVLRPHAAACEKHTHLRLRFEHGIELRLVDPRRFGMAVVVATAALPAFAPLAGLGPDALDGDVEGALLAAARRSRSPIRALLLDQRVVAGVGNIYASEALARAGVHPLRQAAAISSERVARLAGAVKAVLADALAAGGTTLADGGFSDASGNEGYFAVKLDVYGRKGHPCRACGSPIRRQVAGGRSVFYCARCQR